MIRGEDFDESPPEVETEDGLDVDSPAENDFVRPADSGKQFGFASRSEHDRDNVPVEQLPQPPLQRSDAVDRRPGEVASGDMAPGDMAPGDMAPGDMAEAEPPTAAGNHPDRNGPASAPFYHEEPIVSTPHLERLRAQIGARCGEYPRTLAFRRRWRFRGRHRRPGGADCR